MNRHVATSVTGPEYPTPRQLIHWRRCGSLGDQHRRPGSGYRVNFTDAERSQLRRLKRISDDFASLHQPMSVELVHEIWTAMQNGLTAIEHGNIRISLTEVAP